MDRCKHSDYIHRVPDVQLQGLFEDAIDLEVEAKMKNLAVERLRKKLKGQSR